MSRTKRRDKTKEEKPLRGFMFRGAMCNTEEKTTWKDTRDKKPWYKPGKKAKKYLHKGRKSKSKIKKIDDIETVAFDPEKKSDVWRYN